MLAEKPDLIKHPIRFPVYGSIKLDGIRIGIKDGRTWTRSNKEVPNDFTREYLKKFEGLDGEFIVGEPNSKTVFEKSSSAFRSFGGEPEFKYYVFDCISVDPSMPFNERYGTLLNIVAKYNDPRIKAIPQQLIRNQDELDGFYQRALTAGFEGAILKRVKGIYKYGRATAKEQDQLKMKPWVDSEAVVLEVMEAQQNNNSAFTDELGRIKRSSHKENLVGNGMCGEMRVRDIYSGVEFNMAPGCLTHAQRIEIWNNRSKYEGMVATYKFVPIGVKDKPRLNGFKAWRTLADIDLAKAKFLYTGK